MATCPSCAAMVEDDARACWHCQAVIEAAAQVEPAIAQGQSVIAQAAGADSIAPTLHAAAGVSIDGDEMIGREVIGQYVITDKLGAGGMGQVYLADQPSIGRKVAIKVVHAAAADHERAELGQRFRNEAKAAASLDNGHIVSIYNWGSLDDGTLFMAMEYLDGQTLREHLRERRRLPPAEAVEIAIQICEALSDAHAAGIVHRDLKPSNIMLLARVGEDGRPQSYVKVLDFGVAKLEGSDITRSGAMFGTPQYMSPEQLRAERPDGRSDLYSLGVLLYEMLTGALPFSAPTAVGYITAHLHEPPPPLPRDVPPRLAEVVMHLLAKDADERLPDASAVAQELRDAMGGRATRARRRAAEARARRWLWMGLGAFALGLVAYGGWWIWAWSTNTRAALERERSEAEALRKQVDAQTKALEDVRSRAHEKALDVQQATQEARAERERVQRGSNSKLDPETRKMFAKPRPELEAQLREVLVGRRVPPTEVADVIAEMESRGRAVERGELDDASAREQLVALIVLYRRNFVPIEVGDDRPKHELERVFLEMAGPLTLAERRAQLDSTYAEYAQDHGLSPEDRHYYERLAVAAQIRQQADNDPTRIAEAFRIVDALPPPDDPLDDPLDGGEDGSEDGGVAQAETGETGGDVGLVERLQDLESLDGDAGRSGAETGTDEPEQPASDSGETGSLPSL